MGKVIRCYDDYITGIVEKALGSFDKLSSLAQDSYYLRTVLGKAIEGLYTLASNNEDKGKVRFDVTGISISRDEKKGGIMNVLGYVNNIYGPILDIDLRNHRYRFSTGKISDDFTSDTRKVMSFLGLEDSFL